MPSLEQDTVAIVLPPATVDPHGTLRSAAATYRTGFEEAGYQTCTIDLDEFSRADVDLLKSPRIRLIFSDGGWVNTVFTEDGEGKRRLVEFVDKQVLILLNDSPCSYWMGPILEEDRAGQIAAVIDPDFATVWDRWTGRKGGRQVYVPACPPMPQPAKDRPFGTLVVALVQDPDAYRKMVMSRCPDPMLTRLFDGIAETQLSNPLIPFSAACDEACRTFDLCLDYRAEGVRTFLYAVDYYVRNRRRRELLARLERHPITLVGGGEGIRLHPDSTLLPPVSNGQLQKLYGSARSIVVAPPYSGGISERVTHAMGAGALVVSPPTTLSDRLLGRDRLFVTCAGDFRDIDECLERAADPRTRAELTERARSAATTDFSPSATVRRFLAETDGLAF